ncbi:hypothetical protein JCM10213_005834 [Rhodosporidiobolus nylandii]
MSSAEPLQSTVQHTYPTPPLSPDSRSPSASAEQATANLAKQAAPPPAVDGFDPLAGYAQHDREDEHPNATPREAMNAAKQAAAAPPPSSSAGARKTGRTRRVGGSREGSGSHSGASLSYEADADADADGEGEAEGELPFPPSKAANLGPKERNWTREDRRRAKLQPPKDPELFDTEEEWQAHHDEEKTSGWHHLPLVLVALPPLGAIIHGRAENWSDAIILLLVCFYLYQLIKVPWELYYASHARTVLPTSPSSPSSGAPASPSLLAQPADPLAPHRESSTAALRRNELLSLLLTLLVPVLGASLLHYARGLLSDPDRYINRMMIGLFCVASGVRPWMRLVRLLKRNSLYHQSLVHYPSSEVYQLRKRVETLEEDLVQLSRAYATKSDVRTLRDGLDVPLSTLSKAVRRFARQEEFSRLSSDERFAALLETVEGLKVAQAEGEREREEMRRRMELEDASVGRLVVSTARHLVYALAVHAPSSASSSTKEERRWYEKGIAWYAFWPVNVPRAVIGWGVEKAVEVVGVPEGKRGELPFGGGAGKGGKARVAAGIKGRQGRVGPPAVAVEGGKGA